MTKHLHGQAGQDMDLLCCSFLLMQNNTSRKEIHNTKQMIIFYALCVLYVLSVAVVALDTGDIVVETVGLLQSIIQRKITQQPPLLKNGMLLKQP